MSNGVLNGAMNRKVLILLGPVAGIVMFIAVVWMATVFVGRSEYRDPYRAPAATADATPRAEGVAAEKAAADTTPKATPYAEAEYRTFPIVGSRVAIWAVAQLHLLFAAFVLAVPLFAFIIEAIGYKTGDLRYDRLAHEFTKLLSVSFSLTATFGAFLTFMSTRQASTTIASGRWSTRCPRSTSTKWSSSASGRSTTA